MREKLSTERTRAKKWVASLDAPIYLNGSTLSAQDFLSTVRLKRTVSDRFKYLNKSVCWRCPKVLLSVQHSQWHMITPSEDAAGDILVPRPWTPTERDDYCYRCSHVMESRGEVLYVSLHVKRNIPAKHWEDVPQLVRALSLSVYAFQVEVSVPTKMQQVRKDSHARAWLTASCSLGVPTASPCRRRRVRLWRRVRLLHVYSGGDGSSHDWCGVFKYSFADNKAEFIEWLPEGWSD
jgi:hypothetical protein